MKKIYGIHHNGIIWCQIWESRGGWVIHWPEFESSKYYQGSHMIRVNDVNAVLAVLFAKSPECAEEFLEEWT